MISVVCPLYNEENIVGAATELMLKNLESLPEDWELILVNDGSKDSSLQVIKAIEAENNRLRVVSYNNNMGRGYAIRQGVYAARGEIVVTTEVDCSWGDDIVHRIVEEFRNKIDADMIIASPHLPGGGYKNVPPKRVFLSKFGNKVIQAGLTFAITMNTGMTRGYKRSSFMMLPLDANGKEQHLEIVSKALAFGYRIYEIPAVLEWKDHKLSAKAETKRKSSSNIPKLIQSHLVFSFVAAPFRYILAISGISAMLTVIFISLSIINLFTDIPSSNFALLGSLLGLFSFLFFSIGILAHQLLNAQREMWRLRYQLGNVQKGVEKAV